MSSKFVDFMRKGIFVVTDGLDGIGKGVINNSIIEFLKEKGLKVFDIHDFWKEHNEHPSFLSKNSELYIDMDSFDVLVTSQPTFVGVGAVIRNELTANNRREYSAQTIAHAYSMDREILFKKLIIPALDAGKIIIQSRSVSTSIVYQPLQESVDGKEPPTLSEIMALPGNALALKYAPDLLIIPTIDDINKIMTRLNNRDKKDNSQFENIEFQKKIKPLYESKKLRGIFESRGSVVKYIDVGRTIDYTKKESVKVFSTFMTTKGFYK